jgi:alpha-ketoglutarate-dependent 2,4-dichlorophenoxyacetate dioxygenase
VVADATLQSRSPKLTQIPLRPCGIELRGIDLRSSPEQQQFKEIQEAIDEHGIVLMPGQLIDDDAQLAFTALFGELEDLRVNRTRERRINKEGVVDISNLGADGNVLPPDAVASRFSRANQLWHADMSYVARGAAQSILCAKQIVPDGGETEWADMAAAYEALPSHERERLSELTVEHSLMFSRARLGFTEFTQEERERFAPVQHPLVRAHPITGRRFLYIGSHAGRIVGMDEESGRKLLDDLLNFATQERFVYRHRWAVGDLLIWDNRRTLHRGRPANPSYPRVMHRTAVRGDLPPFNTGVGAGA